jgi:hypothetical protein
MDRGCEEANTEESECGGARPLGWSGTQRGQEARQQGERPRAAWSKAARRPSPPGATLAGRGPVTASGKAAVALVRHRFGHMAIGLGETDIRYRRRDFGTAEYNTPRLHSAVGYRRRRQWLFDRPRPRLGRRQCNINSLTPPGTKIGPLIPGSGDWLDEGLRR